MGGFCGADLVTVLIEGDAMKEAYDFSKGVRGKFFCREAVFREPVCLDDDVRAWVSTRAEVEGVDLSTLVNALLRKEMAVSKRFKL